MKSGIWARLAALGLFVGIGLASTAASGDEKAEAKKHFAAGMKLLDREDFAGAAAEFEKSVALYATKNGMFNLANCYQELHRYGEALVAFEKLETFYGDDLGDEMRASVARHRQEILDRVAVLKIEVNISGATISLGGKVIGVSPLTDELYLEPGVAEVQISLTGFNTETRKVHLVAGSQAYERFELTRSPPSLTIITNIPAAVEIDGIVVGETPRDSTFVVAAGRHFVRVISGGYETINRTVVLRTGEERTLDLTLSPLEHPVATARAPEPEEPADRLWTKVAFGVAGGAAAIGLVTGIGAAVKKSDLEDRCGDLSECPDSTRNAHDQAQNLAQTTNAMIAIAAIGAAAGITLFFVEPRLGASEEPVAVAPAASPGGGGLVIQGGF